MTTSKDCGNHGKRRKRIIRGICAAVVVLIFLILLAILIIWAVLRPSKPSFLLRDASIYALNVKSPPNLLNATLQVTISSRNPNRRIGIYYDRLLLYAVYRSQQVTLAANVQGTYQGHKDVNLWSPFLLGPGVPVAPFIADGLNQDLSSGAILLYIKGDGRVRFKVGSVTTGTYRLHVTCPAYISLGSRTSGVFFGEGTKYQLVQRCSVNV